MVRSSYGDTDSALVKSLQVFLNFYRKNNQPVLKEDGDWGDKTQARLRQFDPDLATGKTISGTLMNYAINVADRAATPLAEPTLLALGEILGEEEAAPNIANKGSQLDQWIRSWPTYVGMKPTEPAPPWCAIVVSAVIGLSWAQHVAPWLHPFGTTALDKGDPLDLDWGRTPWGSWIGAVAGWEAWAKKDPKVRAMTEPRVGYLYTMARSQSGSDRGSTTAGHCGFIVGVSPDKKQILCFDGNLGNAARLVTRDVASTRMIIRWG